MCHWNRPSLVYIMACRLFRTKPLSRETIISHQLHHKEQNVNKTIKTRSGVVHELMKRSRARFKYAQNLVLKNEKTLRADALASKLASGDVKCFWRKIKKCNSGNVAFSNKIENETGSQNITNMWRDHYQQLFNSVNDTNDKPYVLSYIRNNHDTIDAVVTVDDMICSIKELPNNKSPGYDGLMSEHFKYASHRLCVLMTIIIQIMIKHGFLPQQFMTTVLVPILKNKNGDIASKSNYRPIALSTVASKILEIILVNHIEEYIVTTENQFAYKKGHSTDMCIFTLKECIRYYTVHSTPCMCVFLMLAKHLIVSIIGNFLKFLLIENALPMLSNY